MKQINVNLVWQTFYFFHLVCVVVLKVDKSINLWNDPIQFSQSFVFTNLLHRDAHVHLSRIGKTGFGKWLWKNCLWKSPPTTKFLNVSKSHSMRHCKIQDSKNKTREIRSKNEGLNSNHLNKSGRRYKVVSKIAVA